MEPVSQPCRDSDQPFWKLRGDDSIAFHDRIASTWETNYQSRAFLSRVEAFDKALGSRDQRGMRWLDAGCGSGTLTRWLAGRGAEAIGVDGAPEMVRAAETGAKQRDYAGGLGFQVADVGALPFSDASFDAVLCSSVLEYAENPASYLSEIARVTKPGGTLLISVPNAESLVRMGLRVTFRVTNIIGKPRPEYMAHSRHQYTKEQFSTLLRICGYTAEYSSAFGDGLPRWLRGRRWVGRLLLFRAVRL